jgi:uncharacterized phage-associated protein
MNDAKYENLILYLCSLLGGRIEGKKKLAKLLYYVDFDRYEYRESMVTVTGDGYRAWRMGPVPVHFESVLDRLVKSGRLSQTENKVASGYNPMEVYECLREPDVSLFDDADRLLIRRVASRYGKLNGSELETLTHAEAPYLGVELNDVIPFELAFYRGTDFDDKV